MSSNFSCSTSLPQFSPNWQFSPIREFVEEEETTTKDQHNTSVVDDFDFEWEKQAYTSPNVPSYNIQTPEYTNTNNINSNASNSRWMSNSRNESALDMIQFLIEDRLEENNCKWIFSITSLVPVLKKYVKKTMVKMVRKTCRKVIKAKNNRVKISLYKEYLCNNIIDILINEKHYNQK